MQLSIPRKKKPPYSIALSSTNAAATSAARAVAIAYWPHNSRAQKVRIVCNVLVSLMFIGPAWSQIPVTTDAPDSTSSVNHPRQFLLGDWGRIRSGWAEKGITFEFFYITDVQGNPSGGKQQTEADWQRVRGTVDINFDQFLQWQGLRFHATGLWQAGGNLGLKIGTLANPSDLVSANAARLDSFWLEQFFLKKKVRVRAGQLAGLDFYGNQDFGGTWLMEPLGYAFGNLFSSVYESFNPAGTPGAEVRFAPKANFYVKAAVMSGNRDPYHQDPTGFEFKIRNTPDFLFETGYLVDPPEDNTANRANPATQKLYPGSYKFGGVFNRGPFSDPAGRTSNGNYLVYGMASQAVFRNEAGSNRGLDATFGFDWAPGDVSRENVQITAGARFNAPFRRRKNDRIACGFVYSKISDPFQGFGELLGGAPLGSEKAIELNYSVQIKPYFLIEPTFQYYVNVGANPAFGNAPVFGLRSKVTF